MMADKMQRIFCLIIAVIFFSQYSLNVLALDPKILSDVIEYNGCYYKLYNISLSWEDAESYCQSLNGHLVSINTESEQIFIESLIADGEKNLYWIGGNNLNDGKWCWSDNSSWIFENWALGEPSGVDGNNKRTIENYLQIYAKEYKHSKAKIGEWNDACGNGDAYSLENFYALENTGFICEWDKDNITILDKPNMIIQQENSRTSIEKHNANGDKQKNSSLINISIDTFNLFDMNIFSFSLVAKIFGGGLGFGILGLIWKKIKNKSKKH